MQLSDFENIVSSLAVITTVLQFLSGALVCKQYVVNKTTAETSSLPFVCGMLCGCLWFLYGIINRDNIIVLVNTIGVTLMISYTAVFYIYTFKKSTVLKQVIGTVVFVILILVYFFLEVNDQALFDTLGLLACSFTIITIAAPLSKLQYVLRVKSTECLPFPMILMSFFVSLLWFLYGTIKDDHFLWMTNLVGAALAVIQLSLFVIYPNKSQSPSLIKNIIA
ncbi:sugar transporter SWEET1 [Helicoverpa zea]|uniref:sugar transporter SWEET1 n=1 Tax=Helicoverpa zea TaxID=7113 RepID=UPI001F58294A|nr:sugar transporter SWEET1 [Helicoverpa zea]